MIHTQSHVTETSRLTAELHAFADSFPQQRDAIEEFTALLRDPLNPFVRERLSGHFTASCWLVEPKGERVLLTHHRKLDRWLQLGGHADGESDLALAALKEAEEESGLSDLQVQPGIFDVDRHTIPARGAEPEHDHFDVRYVIVAMGSLTPTVSEESLDLAWCDITELAADRSGDASMLRMAQRWLGLRDRWM